MKKLKQLLIIEQLDRKFRLLMPLNQSIVTGKGWVYTLRSAMHMSLRQLGSKLGMSKQSAKELEDRESNGSITLKSLREAAEALDMKLVYGFIPKEGGIEKMIEKQALKKAGEIVLRTSNTMELEDQKNSNARIQKAIKEKAEEIKTNLPKYLWD